MAIIDPEGLFNGDRLRRCSNLGQLHWPRLFLASDGYGRLEINYARIIGRAYPGFNPTPSEADLQTCIQDYVNNFLLFVYHVDGQCWGQWDTRNEFLPRYKTASDKRSPIPPAAEFIEWKRRYREQYKSLPKSFGNFSAEFLRGVGGGKSICASKDARLLSIDKPSREITVADSPLPERTTLTVTKLNTSPEQQVWFSAWWNLYWLHKAKKQARDAFQKQVKTASRFEQVMVATRAQSKEMLTQSQASGPMGPLG